MEKMLITLVIEGNKEDIHTIKGNILATASDSLVSCSVNTIGEQKVLKTDLIFSDNVDPYEIRKA